MGKSASGGIRAAGWLPLDADDVIYILKCILFAQHLTQQDRQAAEGIEMKKVWTSAGKFNLFEDKCGFEREEIVAVAAAAQRASRSLEVSENCSRSNHSDVINYFTQDNFPTFFEFHRCRFKSALDCVSISMQKHRCPWENGNVVIGGRTKSSDEHKQREHFSLKRSLTRHHSSRIFDATSTSVKFSWKCEITSQFIHKDSSWFYRSNILASCSNGNFSHINFIARLSSPIKSNLPS